MKGSGSAELQQREWLGDMCEGGVEKVRLHAGDTMIIPAGWIHAVVGQSAWLSLTLVHPCQFYSLWGQLFTLLLDPHATASTTD